MVLLAHPRDLLLHLLLHLVTDAAFLFLCLSLQLRLFELPLLDLLLLLLRAPLELKQLALVVFFHGLHNALDLLALRLLSLRSTAASALNP